MKAVESYMVSIAGIVIRIMHDVSEDSPRLSLLAPSYDLLHNLCLPNNECVQVSHMYCLK